MLCDQNMMSCSSLKRLLLGLTGWLLNDIKSPRIRRIGDEADYSSNLGSALQSMHLEQLEEYSAPSCLLPCTKKAQLHGHTMRRCLVHPLNFYNELAINSF
jgi:hypothetical protein